jgi:MFS family permease
LFVSLLALSFFWVVGALFHLNFPVYADHLLHLSRSETSLLLALTAVGIGAGGMLSGWLSGRKVELGFVPAGAVLMAAFSLHLWAGPPSVAWVGVDVAMLGVGGGFYLIPLVAFVQKRAPRRRKGMIMAIANFVSLGGMLLAAGLYFLAGRAGSAPMFGLLAALVFLATALISIAMPEFLLRMLLWPYAHVSCRLRLQHPERVPARGGALLVAPGLNLRDGLRMVAGLGRYVRLAVVGPGRTAGSARLSRWLWKAIRVPADDPGAALERVRAAVADGQVVCLCGADVDEDAFRRCARDAREGLEGPAMRLAVSAGKRRLRRRLAVRFRRPD